MNEGREFIRDGAHDCRAGRILQARAKIQRPGYIIWKGVFDMLSYEKDVLDTERKLIKEISNTKFSWKKIRLLIELNALVNHN